MVIIGFQKGIFLENVWGTQDGGFHFNKVFPQVKNSMLVTVWVFIGVEGAVVFSSRARRKSDVGKATVIGFSQ